MTTPGPDDAGHPWYAGTGADALARLGTSAAGLSAREAAVRLARDGPNRLSARRDGGMPRMVLDQFKSLIIWILIAAGAAAAVLGDLIDAVAIFAIVVLNAAIGIDQQFKAARSIAALDQLTAPHARVHRDDGSIRVPAADVVAGDILELEPGDVVAADARLLDDRPLGDRANMVFMGTSVAAGTGRAVVVATAMRTELGLIARLLDDAGRDAETPLQQRLGAFGRVLVWAALAIVAMLFGIGLLRGASVVELLKTSVGLAVAAVPEGLPAVVTVARSLGVMRMARRRALVRRLAAVETLGSTSVICTDKTGTLTVGEMTVRALYVASQRYQVTGQGYGPAGAVLIDGAPPGAAHTAPLRELATVLLGCNNAHLTQADGAWQTVGDPTEGALLVAGTKTGGDRQRIEQELPQVRELPFDSDRKRSTVVRRTPDGSLRAFTNGAPGVLLRLSEAIYTTDAVRPLTAQDRAEVEAEISRMARQGLRVLGAASRDLGDTAPADLTADVNLVTDGAPALCLANDPIDADVMRRAPVPRSARITSGGFLWTMAFTGVLTAGVALAVYLYVLRTGDVAQARTSAFAVVVFAELLRAFGARSETRPVWRISLRTNIALVVVVAASFALQVGSQHSDMLGRFLRTSSMPLAGCLALVAIGAIPLVALELIKLARRRR